MFKKILLNETEKVAWPSADLIGLRVELKLFFIMLSR